jgi:NAD(P)-dependent dehydrogenase (short-subunit alcohol dehydrogenase family)
LDLQLTGRRALVSGSSSGIGECIARMLAEEGCAVVVHGRDRERAEAVAASIGAAGVAVGSLDSDESALAVFEAASAALGGSVEMLAATHRAIRPSRRWQSPRPIFSPTITPTRSPRCGWRTMRFRRWSRRSWAG